MYAHTLVTVSMATAAATGGHELSLLEVGPIIFGGTQGIITFLRSKRLLASRATCLR